MDVQFGPNSIDEPNLLYKLQHKVKVFKTKDSLQNRGYNLVASSSKYGLVFIGVPDGTLSVYYLNQLIDKECEPQHLVVKLKEKPTHISVSCDQELLAVTGGQYLCVYKITDFQNQNVSPSLSLQTEVSASNFVSAMQWNPCIPDSLAIAFYDGTLIAYQLSTVQVKKVQSKARCICWSPKGKQLVTGNSDGTLFQYKPDLTLAKMVTTPNLFEASPAECLAIYWISTFQFAVVYKNATDNSRPAMAIVNAGKTGQPTCLNYEDVCFSMGNTRPWYYYLHGMAQWNIILASSSNSMEMATLGSADGANWVQWCQTDEARPELPLTDKKLENYPVGLCVDTSALHQLPWGENEVLPNMPLLLVLSQTGLLTLFNIVNLNKQAPQLCSPPKQLMLPTSAMTSEMPDDTAEQPSIVQPNMQPKEQTPPVQVTLPLPSKPFVPASDTNISANISASSQNYQQVNATFDTAPASQLTVEKEIKPAVVSQTQPVQQTPAIPPSVNQTPNLTQVQENAALKAEQERLTKMKANQELKDMLIKEVNEFQMEIYKFMLKTQETQTKLQRDIDSINANFDLSSMDADQLKKECSLDDLRSAVVQLKLELVRACAVVAEARTHADAKDLHQWTQADPLTTKRVASVKKLAYYVQNQLDQAQKSLDFKWNELSSNDSQNKKPGHRMIRPRLDDVYQPLVKQQEILGRQEAVLRTLRNTLKECEYAPVFKPTSLLRSTPFRKDPLSKLTKNILNMSIEPQNKPKETLLTAQKIDVLRDTLSNHKIIKTKPVSVELRKHLAKIRKNYEKSLREKSDEEKNIQQTPVKVDPLDVKSEVKSVLAPINIIKKAHLAANGTNNGQTILPPSNIKVEPRTEVVKPIPTVPTFTPVVNIKPALSFGNVARTLFADEPKQEIARPQVVPQTQQAIKQVPSQGFAPFNSTTASAATKSVLKDLLQNKSQTKLETKNDATNTFMGQKICSPSSFSYKPTPSTESTPSNIFTSKPISEINNMFSKFQPQTFVSETKPKITVIPKSNETGEPEGAQIIKPVEEKKIEQPTTNTIPTKAVPMVPNTSNIPDVLKNNQQEMPKIFEKPVLNIINKNEQNEENVPEFVDITPKSAVDIKENIAKPNTSIPSTKADVSYPKENMSTIVDQSGSIQKIKETDKRNDVEEEIEKSELTGTPLSIFETSNVSLPPAPKPQPVAVPTVITPSVSKQDVNVVTESTTPSDLTVSKLTSDVTKSLPSSIFSAAVTSQAKPSTPTGSIFSASTTSTASSLFGPPTQGSIFGSTSTSNSIFASTAQSVSPIEAKSSIFSTPISASPTSIFGAVTTQPESSSTETLTQTLTPSEPSLPSNPTATTFEAPIKPESSVLTTTSSLFGTTTTTQSIFGSAATTTSTFSPASTTQSIFGTTTPTTQASVFGNSNGQTSVFGFKTPTTQSIFGTSTSPASVFGSATTQTSVFGSPTATQPSIFGTPTQTTQGSLFGTPTQTTQSSIFGTPTQTTQSSLFGTPAQTIQTSIFGSTTQSVFGAPTQTTQASVFGTPTTNAQSGSLFGGAEANLFASASISTTSASQSSAGSIFGGSVTSGSVFGNNNTNVFGGKTTFGQNDTTAASIFGGAAAFGQKPASSFWSGANANAGSGFGTCAFGQPATTQASSIFGNTTGGSFSTPQHAGQAFGSPQAAAFGGAENKPSVFSSPQPSGPGFGGSAVFGGKPAFGQPAGFSSPPGGGFGSFGGFNKSPTGGFGAQASFGGSPTFGGSAFGGSSPNKSMFGGAPAAPSFAQTQSNATFESLATQNTLTFGNLAQQSGQPPQQAPAFNTSPSFTGWRG